MIIPDGILQAYLSQNSLQSRLALLEGGIGPHGDQLERVLDTSLEAAWLFGGTPLPAAQQASLIASLDGLCGPLVVSAVTPGTGAEGSFLSAAPTRAAVLDAIRSAWTRAWTPSALLNRFSQTTDETASPAVWPIVEVLEESELAPGGKASVGRRFERLPDGSLLELAPEALRAALDEAQKQSDNERIPLLSLYIRYSLGSSYNALAQPADPFGFLDLVLAEKAGEAVSRSIYETYASLCRAAGLAGELEYVELAKRSLELEIKLEPEQHLTHQGADPGSASRGSSATKNHQLQPQQLIGAPSSPGRASGTLRHGPAPFAAGTVLACRRFTRQLAAGRPVAVLELGGGRIGTGALLARAAGLPCVSGISDLSLLPDGAVVMVDGGLGLVSVIQPAKPGWLPARPRS